ncbi:MAG: 50S ribosomal protein L4 [Patescibacteria group bacterium]|nr:50S ribosomal protein L4 [Patescibacteria group bacterium]MDE1945665.1 50S ribosomal protein L4 [Patescibacteria group bacterium]
MTKAAPKAKTASEISAKVYDQSGKSKGDVKLPADIFGLSWNADLVHQVVHSMLSDRRTIFAHTKNRGQVRGGGKKPWQQKGTGRARHGSTRSPIWVGGGVAHGPNNLKNYGRKVNKKMKAKALFTVLSKKMQDGEVLFVSDISIAKPKTTDAIGILKSLASVKGYADLFTKKKNSAYIAVAEKNPAVEKSFANLGNVKVDEMRNINPVDILNMKYVVIEQPAAAVAFLERKMK